MGVIRAFEFLDLTDYLFSGFTSTIGENINGKYSLRASQTLHNYIKKCKDGEKAGLKQNHVQIFVDKCCYYLYPEKRAEEYKNKNGESVESPDVFSEKCVTLFFQLSGIDFNILRISSDGQRKFSNEQKKCLVALFSDVMQLFRNYQDNQIEKVNFRKFLKLEYTKFRYALFKIDSTYLADKFYPFLNAELVHYIEYALYAHLRLNSWFIDANYVIGREKTLSHMKSGYKQSITYLNRLMEKIEFIAGADDRKEVEDNFVKMIKKDAKLWGYTEDELKSYKEIFLEPAKKEWKNRYIQFLIEKSRKYYLTAFVESVMFKGNYNEAALAVTNLCERIVAILEKVEIKDLEMNVELIDFITNVHEMLFFIGVQRFDAYDEETDSNDFTLLDDLD